MAMIGDKEITADTDISELLDLDKVESILDRGYDKVTKELNNRIDDIDTELNRGLSRETFSMNGCEKLYDSAVTAKNSQEQAVLDFDNVYNSIMTSAITTRINEIQELISALEEKISDLGSIIEGIEYNTGAYNQSCGAMGGDPISPSDFDENYGTYVTQKADYEEKLETVKGLLGGE